MPFLLIIAGVSKQHKKMPKKVFHANTGKRHENRLEIYTVFVAVSNETATLTLWPLVIATAGVFTAVRHILNGHSVVGAVVYTEFCAVFSHWMAGSAVHSAVSPFH